MDNYFNLQKFAATKEAGIFDMFKSKKTKEKPFQQNAGFANFAKQLTDDFRSNYEENLRAAISAIAKEPKDSWISAGDSFYYDDRKNKPEFDAWKSYWENWFYSNEIDDIRNRFYDILEFMRGLDPYNSSEYGEYKNRLIQKLEILVHKIREFGRMCSRTVQSFEISRSATTHAPYENTQRLKEYLEKALAKFVRILSDFCNKYINQLRNYKLPSDRYSLDS